MFLIVLNIFLCFVIGLVLFQMRMMLFTGEDHRLIGLCALFVLSFVADGVAYFYCLKNSHLNKKTFAWVMVGVRGVVLGGLVLGAFF